jgi:hypothetical protein
MYIYIYIYIERERERENGRHGGGGEVVAPSFQNGGDPHAQWAGMAWA